MPDLDGGLPASLRKHARWRQLGPTQVPALLAHPDVVGERPPTLSPRPGLLWIHGRTVNKELDPGRYLRCVRAGIAVCAVDLPGHGERFDQALQSAAMTLTVVERMVHEIDSVVNTLVAEEGFDPDRIAIGGMSAGGMATLVRLCRPHRFRCATVEATTGSWRWQSGREMFIPDAVGRLNPIDHLEQWREIPFQAIHAQFDEWVNINGQREFIDRIRSRYIHPDWVEMVEFERTGAPFEHAGFGRLASIAKDRQMEFLERRLVNG